MHLVSGGGAAKCRHLPAFKAFWSLGILPTSTLGSPTRGALQTDLPGVINAAVTMMCSMMLFVASPCVQHLPAPYLGLGCVEEVPTALQTEVRECLSPGLRQGSLTGRQGRGFRRQEVWVTREGLWTSCGPLATRCRCSR